MSNSQSIKIWGALAALLVLFGLVWAVFPLLTGQPLLGGLPAPVEPITTPAFLTGVFGEEMSPVLAAALLAGLVVVLISGAGGALGFLYTFLTRLVNNTMETSDYQEKAAELEKKEKAQLKELQEGRKAPGKPDHAKPGWSAVSTTLIMMIFAASFGLVIARTFYPEVYLQQADGSLFNPGPLITGGMALLALLAGYIWFRPQRIQNVDETDNEGIPWDVMAVLITGLVIVGLGVAIAILINQPA